MKHEYDLTHAESRYFSGEEPYEFVDIFKRAAKFVASEEMKGKTILSVGVNIGEDASTSMVVTYE